MASSLAEADVIRSLLAANGLEATVPDENLAGLAWHLGQAIGGVRVQVREGDFESAAKLLDAANRPGELDGSGRDGDGLDPEGIGSRGFGEVSAPQMTTGEELAHRALKAAVIGTLLVVVMPHACALSLRALSSGDLSPRSYRQAWIAFILSVAWTSYVVFVAVRVWPYLGG